MVGPALLFLVFLSGGAGAAVAQSPGQSGTQAPSRASILRGEYGPYRANNDLLYYHLDIRVDPDKKLVTGKNPPTRS